MNDRSIRRPFFSFYGGKWRATRHYPQPHGQGLFLRGGLVQRIVNLRFLKVYASSGLLWFRLFGKGLHIKDVRRHPLIFCQRTTWLPLLSIGNWQVRWLA
jgi:hypothetical protein